MLINLYFGTSLITPSASRGTPWLRFVYAWLQMVLSRTGTGMKVFPSLAKEALHGLQLVNRFTEALYAVIKDSPSIWLVCRGLREMIQGRRKRMQCTCTDIQGINERRDESLYK